MGKGHYNLSLDAEIWDQAQRTFPHQISGLVNDYLRSLVATKKRDINSVQIEIERLKLKQDVEVLNKVKSSIDDRQIIIKNFEEAQEKQKEAELLKQKEKMEKEVSCYKCSNVASKKYQDNPICSSCFMSL
jgi:hypothetical protein